MRKLVSAKILEQASEVFGVAEAVQIFLRMLGYIGRASVFRSQLLGKRFKNAFSAEHSDFLCSPGIHRAGRELPTSIRRSRYCLPYKDRNYAIIRLLLTSLLNPPTKHTVLS